MRVGVDGKTISDLAGPGPGAILNRAHQLGLEGVFFRSILDLSPTLDPGELREVRAQADTLGLYLEVGIGIVNPYATAEAPTIRVLGAGDYRLGMERLIRAARAIDCTELWAVTGSYKPELPGFFAIDRFRTDAPWPDQLTATEQFLRTLAPILRDLNCRLNIETHEEITSFEVVRLVESVGPDVLGVTFDTANVLINAEDSVAATRRIAPYVHLTHLRDAVLSFTPDGLIRQIRPCGQGILDWTTILAILAEYAPRLNLSIEAMSSQVLMGIQIFDPRWQAAHPDLTVAEVAEITRLAKRGKDRTVPSEPSATTSEQGQSFGEAQKIAFLQQSAAYLRALLATHA